MISRGKRIAVRQSETDRLPLQRRIEEADLVASG